MEFRKLNDEVPLEGKRVLLRLDLNVRISEGRVFDDFRIKKILPTLTFLRKKNARAIILSHIESPETNSLEILKEYLSNLFPVSFAKNFNDLETAVSGLSAGSFLMFENLRLNPGEKSADESFAKRLSSFGDIYVNESFSVSHREHASIILLPKFLPAYAGFLFADEVSNLSRAFQPIRPALLIIGGAKFETKLPLVEKFLGLYDQVFVVGGLANDCFRAKGFNVGVSVVGGTLPDLSNIISNPKLTIPIDVLARNEKGVLVKRPDEISDGDKIVDAGPRTLEILQTAVKQSKFILWNGPLGIYEDGFRKGTEELVKVIAAADADSIVGGGDTYAAISSLEAIGKFSFISTGGGAMLQFLANETLPGLDALKASAERS